MTLIQSSSVAPRPGAEGITQRATGTPRRTATHRVRHGLPKATATAASRPNNSAVPAGMDGELWQSLTSDELDHFMGPGTSPMLFGAGYSATSKHGGIPRGMHLDVRA